MRARPLASRGVRERAMNPTELKMDSAEREFWERIRRRGSMWYLVSKGLAFMILYPAAGLFVFEWAWTPTLLVEGWILGIVAGAFVFMRKELRYRFTLEEEGLPIPDPLDE